LIFKLKKRDINKALIFKFFLYCFLGAVFLGLLFEFKVWVSYLFLVFNLVVLFFGHKNKKILLLFFSFLGIFLGWWLTAKEVSKIFPREEVGFSSLSYISQEPEMSDEYQKIIICPIEIKLENNKKTMEPICAEKILVFDSLGVNYNFGEIIKVSCQLKNPENKHNKFNYINFLAKDNIYQICQNQKINRINNIDLELGIFYKVKTFFYRQIFKIKTNFENKINISFSFPESAYLAGLLLGGENRLPLEIQENFRKTGTTHTIAVSGFNITVLASFFMFLGVLIGFYRQKAFWLAVLGIIFFVLMIGSPSSAVRAAIMGILILWASKKGRLIDSVQIIILAGALMIAFSPLILLYDVGFQLSFLASLGIVLVYAPLSERFNIRNDFLELKSILLVTISAQLGVMGILLYTFETFSPISLLANLIILPIIPLLMLTGFITVTIAFLNPLLANFFALPTQLALKLEISIIEKLAEISWSSLEIGDIGILGLVIYYIFFFLVVVFLKNKT